MSVKAVGDALATLLNRVGGLRVHRYPPSQLAEFPGAFIYPKNGRFEPAQQLVSRNFHNWHIDVLTSNQLLPNSAESTEPYVDAIQDELWKDATLSGTVDHIGTNEDITFEMLAYDYAGKPVFGYRIVVPIKYHRIIT